LNCRHMDFQPVPAQFLSDLFNRLVPLILKLVYRDLISYKNNLYQVILRCIPSIVKQMHHPVSGQLYGNQSTEGG
jgi:hypothetical protein